MRPGPSIAQEQRATFTASPSFAGAKAFTSAPTPRPAAARRGGIRPPAAANPARQAPTVHAKAATKLALAARSQNRSALPRTSIADATRLPRSWGDRARLATAARASAEAMSCFREMVMDGRSLHVTHYIAAG